MTKLLKTLFTLLTLYTGYRYHQHKIRKYNKRIAVLEGKLLSNDNYIRLVAIYELAETSKRLMDENKQYQYVTRQIIESLPSNRDWLDPDIERAARRLLEAYNEGNGGK
tara:strand:+ start:458 stop:784 length:327 start_codon:yes stop_codon:yes gene_type:complete